MKLICPNQSLFSIQIKENLKKKFKCDFFDISQNKFDNIIRNYDIVLCRFSKNINFINNHKIKFILSPTTGLNHIDKKYFNDKKVKIITLKNSYTFLKKINASSELTVLLILNFQRKINKIFQTKKKIIGKEINGKKIGIIGYGRIGKKVGKILKSFGAEIFFYDKKKIKGRKTLEFILKNSDIISIHIPLEEANINFLNRKRLNKIKKNTLIVNTSRGEVIDESHLINKLKNKELSYATDVVSGENFNQSKRFLKLKFDNLLITPHIGGLTEESIHKTDMYIYKKFIKEYEKKINLHC